MNKVNLRTYAPKARLDFIAAVTARADLLGITAAGATEATIRGDVALIDGREWPARIMRGRAKLVETIALHGFEQTMDEVAYTWFNRFAALRYMELHDYLDHGWRVLSSRDGGLPEILLHASDVELSGLDRAKALDMHLSGTRDNELYKMLLVAQCNELSRAMPFLFERIDDETELLLPDNLLRTDSIVAKLVGGIPEEDWDQIEIIGWLYQFYISEKKDQVIGKVVRSEDIPAATQLFTPNWIVQYLVQNSLGRIWIASNPSSSLQSGWPFYIPSAEQPPEVRTRLSELSRARVDEDGGSLNPESITVLDPACGSGHILVEAYDVLKAIYLERGYQPRSIPRLILAKNLFGLDIDDRAAQMAGFALMMKARADDRRLFSETVVLNVMALHDTRALDADVLARALEPLGWRPGAMSAGASSSAGDLFPSEESTGSLRELIETLINLFSNAKTLGALIQVPNSLSDQLSGLVDIVGRAAGSGDLYAQAAAADLLPLVSQALTLGMQFDVVVANPPYMGGKGMNAEIKEFAATRYPDSKADMFAMFIERCQSFGRPSAELGFVTPYVWMFISSYEAIRTKILRDSTIQSLIQLEYNAFEPACVPVCAFVVGKKHVPDYVGSYVKLSDFKGHESQAPKTLEAIGDPACGWFFKTKSDNFMKIPGSPVAYWVDEGFFDGFSKGRLGDSIDITGSQNITADNGRYLRHWYELDGADVGARWRFYCKGGTFRKYYGNLMWCVDWSDDARAFYKANKGSNLLGPAYWYREGITYTDITSSMFNARYMPEGCLYDKSGPAFHPVEGDLHYILALINTKPVDYILKILNPSFHCQVRDVKNIPRIDMRTEEVSANGKELVAIAKADWDANETSHGFAGLWSLGSDPGASLADAWGRWEREAKASAEASNRLEERNNQIFIEAYGLGHTLDEAVSEAQTYLAKPDRQKDAQRFVSYAIGCMMGRYSLDAPGLAYAGSDGVGFDPDLYARFAASADGIVPMTYEAWFDEDAALRITDFVAAVWGAEGKAANMAWLAESLGAKTSESSEEALRRYLADKLYKDHIQVYKKRPIYWHFSSGKLGAFQALVYMHRYNGSTLPRMRSEYVVPLLGRMAARLDMLELDSHASSSPASRTKIQKQIEALRRKHSELMAFDERLRHYADMRITIDMADGTQRNYAKFGDLVSDVKTIVGDSDE